MKKEIDEFLKSNQSVYGEGYTSNVPNFYNSLRQGFDFYFRTFQSKNSSYDSYTFSFNNMDSPFNLEQQKRMQEDYINRDFTDEDNFLLSIVSFQRFFELLIKNILFEIDERLVLKVNSSDILSIINPSIKADKFTQKIEAGEAISRIKKLYKRNDNGMFGDYFPDFDKVRLSYQFLVDEENISTIEQLNSWRNALLHGGTIFPNLRAVDYFFCKHIVPLVSQVIKNQDAKVGPRLYYYLETITGVNLLDKINSLKLDISSLNRYPLDDDTSESLLRLGHIKEFGRANMTMNFFMRVGHDTYQYNYHDVFGRGARFAEAEKQHEHYRVTKSCPCCGKESLVLYEHLIDDIFGGGRKKSIQWATCYTCSYHIRSNVGDPFYLGLSKEPIFDYKPRYSLIKTPD